MTGLLEATVVDSHRWPDVAAVPNAPLKARAVRLLLRRLTRRLPISVVYPGAEAGRDEGRPVLRVLRPDAFHHRIAVGGLIGFGEAYQAGDWTADDLPGLLTVLATDMAGLVPGWLQRLRRFHGAEAPSAELGTVGNARRNIERHYDLSNELFALFLDETMTYSAALFDRAFPAFRAAGGAPGTPQWSDLAPAQHRKIDRLLDQIRVRPGTRLLEIGTGWGELAIRAARRGATVHSVTLSAEQLRLARERAGAAGVGDRVTVQLCDYRDIPGTARFDAVASVEMVEAVGERFWPAYFGTLRRLVVPGGRIGLQAITMPHERYLATRNTYTWMQKYIFPGGLLPSPHIIEYAPGLRTVDRLSFGRDYAETLRLWRQRFTARAAEVAALGFDEVFRRTWEFYLAYCQAGFAAGYIDVHQYTLEAA
ncbi:SAM-dependent methyltransferase [Hamadaea tsunoensis]|uniref:SAM-dependent methyltransferase n=1 Tax=Hamadaea tsunoensis TaxID=53368 RepID=UPI0004264760|nr:cyclopropane-fatty-acyl-phospholipid synthase family protein [Hamadaea tsunoensis]